MQDPGACRFSAVKALFLACRRSPARLCPYTVFLLSMRLGREREIWFSGVSSCRDTSHRESGPILMTSRDLISKMQPH